MVVAFVLALVVAVAFGVLAALARRAGARERVRAERAETELAAARADLAATAEARDAATAEVAALRTRLDATAAQLTQSEQELAGTSARLDEARLASDAAEAWARSAEAELAALWALELARSERRWEHSVAPGPGAPSPFGDTADPLRLAVEVEAQALREEVGTRIAVDWGLDGDVGPVTGLALLRLAQELMTTAAPRSEEVVLRVEPQGHDVLVTLDAIDERDARVDPTLPASHPAWRPVAAHTVRVVRRAMPAGASAAQGATRA